MTPLIALPAPWLPEAGTTPAQSHDQLPQLPALTALLRRARRVAACADWREGVQAALGGGSGMAAVEVAAQALTQPPQSALCFAAPLHMVAGISRVHLPPGGRLQLEAAEEQAWCAQFNQDFGADGLRLHVAAPGGGWLLEAPFASGARDPAPELLVGEALQRQPATGSAERALRRLGTEVEMWLAAHALNREREARREPPLNALWFWGGAPVPQSVQLHAPAAILALCGADAWLAGLARHCGQQVAPATCWQEAWRVLADSGTASGTHRSSRPPLIVLAPDGQGAGQSYWRMLEENWFAPVWLALQARQIAGARLQIGRTTWLVPRRAPLQWLDWRRPSWWQRSGEARP